MRTFALSAVAFFGLSAAAMACPTFSQTGQQSYTVTGPQLQSGNTYNVVAGGPNNLRDCPQIGIDRTGYFIAQPDFSFMVSQMSGYDLDLTVQGEGGCDTTLLMNTPDTTWYFDDDGAGNLQPTYRLSQLRDGRLDVWVGTYAGDYCNATLALRSVQAQAPVPAPQPAPAPQPQPEPLAAACPTWQTPGQTISISGPAGTSVGSRMQTAGGDARIGDCPDLGLTVSGYVTSQPTYSLNLSEMTGYNLTLGVQGVGGCDTVLLVNRPNTEWDYDDDSAGNLQPTLTLSDLADGRLDVWVGTWGSNRACQSTFTYQTVPVQQPGPQPDAAGCPDPSRPGPSIPVTGPAATGGYQYPITLTGSTVVSDCPSIGVDRFGFFAAEAQFSLNVSQMAGYDLRLNIDSQCDPVILTHSGQGNWQYNDDAGGSLNSELTLSGLGDGRVDIWAGQFGGGADCPATLRITTLPEQAQTTPPVSPEPAGACPDYQFPGTVVAVAGPSGTMAQSYQVTAGGDARIGDCPEIGLPYSGYFSQAATYSLNLSQMAGHDLQLNVNGGDCDTVLLVNRPNTQWEYDDDGAGNLQPTLTLSDLSDGRLDVWVGTWGSNRNCPATFTYRTISTAPTPSPQPGPTPTPAGGCPTFATPGQQVTITGDALYAPQSYATTANAGTNIAECNLPGIDRTGYFTQAPQYTFYLSGMANYRLVADVDSPCDAALLINTANGTWYFDDDSNGNLDPRLELTTDADLEGRVDVWVGTWNNQSCGATLNMETWLR